MTKQCADCETEISARATRCCPCQNKRSGKARQRTVEQIVAGGYHEEDRGHETPCWIWDRSTDSKGYAHIQLRTKKMARVHTALWEATNGPLPPGHDLHHRCEVRLCIRPDHLEKMTRREHMLADGRLERLVARNRARSKRTACDHTADRDRHGEQAAGADRQAPRGVGEERGKVLVLRRADDGQELHDRSSAGEGQRRHG